MAKSVQFDSSDRFCLDGDYLIKVADEVKGITYRPTEFRPEHDPFTKVMITGTDELGPVSFIVILRNGRKFYYGKDKGSRIEGVRATLTATKEPSHEYSQQVRYAWLLTEVVDSCGNGMYIQYLDPDQERRDKGEKFTKYEKRPQSIHYTFKKRG